MSLLVLLLFSLMTSLVMSQDDAPLVQVGSNDVIPAFLTDADGFTLYMFVPDDANCVDACLENWPPLTVSSDDELTFADGVMGTLGTYERQDGTLQVTYNDMPLYRFIRDEEPGDTNGEGVNNVWYVVEPVMIYVGRKSPESFNFLVGANGYTLYLFTLDDANCVDNCLVNWPPLTVESEEDITVSYRLSGETGVFEREDGTLQVTYNGAPLYYFINDESIGSVNGEGFNDVWYVIETIGIRTSAELGQYLVGPDGYALYLFTPDDANCVDNCLVNWPPLMTPVEAAITTEAGLMGELTFFDRDGMLQASYNGAPLYYFINDETPADTNGQGVNDVWYLVTPEGEALGTE